MVQRWTLSSAARPLTRLELLLALVRNLQGGPDLFANKCDLTLSGN
jgi:hypothetical protein